MRSTQSSRNSRIWAYSKPVSDPPKSVSAYDEEGNPIGEELLLVGWFLCRDRDWLKSHQIDISYGYYHPRRARFECCLVSLENYQVLRDLQLKGDFQMPFYLTYSLGELCHQEQLKTSHISTRPILPEWAYLVHPDPKNRQKLSLWQERRRGRLRLVEGAISSS